MTKLQRNNQLPQTSDLDSLLIKTWVRIGQLPEVQVMLNEEKNDVVQKISSKPSYLGALEDHANTTYEQREAKRTQKRQNKTVVFERIKETIDTVFEDFSENDTPYLGLLFHETPVFLEKEKRRYQEPISPIEAIFIRTGKNLTSLNLYSDTGVYIMEKSLRKMADFYSENGSLTQRGVNIISGLTKEYGLFDFAYNDNEGTHYLRDTIKELLGEKEYTKLTKQFQARDEWELHKPVQLNAYALNAMSRAKALEGAYNPR